MSELLAALATAVLCYLAVLPIVRRADREVEALRAENRRLQGLTERMAELLREARDALEPAEREGRP